MININMNIEDVPLNEVIAKVEAAAYEHAMKEAKFNQSKAARLLGVSRGTMRKKLELYYPGVYINDKE